MKCIAALLLFTSSAFAMLDEPHDLDYDDSVVWTPRELDSDFDDSVYDAPIVEFQDHLWIPIYMIHFSDCPCRLKL